MTKVAVIGTQGVPANYGGFESLVENIIGPNCSKEVEYTVFCSAKDMTDRRGEYKGASLKYIPLHANGMQSIPYDILSMLRAVKGYDVLLVLGVSGCLALPFIMPMIRNKKLIINIDGLEHKRDKWGKLARRILLASEKMAVKYADVVIADNKGIADYVADTYGKKAEMIAYGGDHARRDVSEAGQAEILAQYGLTKGDYGVCVCRIEPENNCHITLEAFADSGKNLIFVGNWNNSEYGRNLRKRYAGYENLHLADAVYNLDVLYTLRSNAGIYVHGHSAGGTNPSLVEAMFFGRPIAAFDVIYNRETTHGKAHFFKNANELRDIISASPEDGDVCRNIAEKEYTWAHIAAQYEKLY